MSIPRQGFFWWETIFTEKTGVIILGVSGGARGSLRKRHRPLFPPNIACHCFHLFRDGGPGMGPTLATSSG